MNSFWAIFLGILQGLTEFLPVSSSGHLVIAQEIIPNFNQPGILFDVVLHAGTLFSVIFFFRKKILKLKAKYIWFLLLGTIPAGLVGYFFQTEVEGLFESMRIVGYALLLTGIMNLLTDKVVVGKRSINTKSSLIVGFAQAVAIIPGVSRSGSTIFAGTFSGLTKKSAAEFSFLLSVPAILGANILEIAKTPQDNTVNLAFYILGFLSAFLAGFFAINFVVKLLLRKRFKVFGIYCLALGVLVSIFS